ncbi:MAG: hypothetical protein A3B44_00965 [Candidatus Levybacteria bacterium RIFCSPLOWO2_01_FULL_38_21]|nr:MAG: hypothetical protein A3B44_00965 [Candidatus Levybacteria bacterium RIFCSPLOWO2_01_FULL_38_21]
MKFLAKVEKNREFWFLLVASFIFFLLRFPSLFEPYWYGDEGIYQVLGIAIRNGRLLYRDIWDNKPPLLYILYSFFNSDQFWLRLVSVVFGILALIAFYALSKKLFQEKGRGNKIAILSTSIFGFLFALPLVEGNIANAENFMLLFIILAGLLIFDTKEKINNKVLVLSGFLLGISFLFKIVGIFDFAAFFVFLFILNLPKNISNLKKIVYNRLYFLMPLVLGFLFPIIISALFFLFNGFSVFKYFLEAIFVQNVGYVGYGNKFIIPQGLLIFKLLLLISFTLFLLIRRNKFSKSALFILIWFAFSLFNALFAGRSYTHYVLIIIPSFSLLIGLLFWEKKYQFPLIVIFIISFYLILANFSFYGKTFSYYQNFFRFLTGRETVAQYRGFFDRKTPVDYELAQFIKTKSIKDENVFIWGNNAQVYTLSGKLPPGRYAVAYHISGYRDGINNTKEALARKKPKFIIIMPDQNQIPFSLYNYGKGVKIDNVLIYERLF